MNPSDTRISVVIPTLNRKKMVEDVLSDINNQTYLATEVIIVDQSPDGEKRDFELSNGVPVRWLVQQEKNASVARNRGALLANSEWIVFLDDDVRFTRDLLENYIRVIEDLNPDACTGGVLGPKDKWSKTPVFERDGKYFRPWRILSSYRTTADSIKVEATCSANLLLRKKSLLTTGGFDERYPGICEDAELGFRMSKEGYSIWHDPRPWVNHLMLMGGSRPIPKTFEEKYLSILRPRTLAYHLLLLGESFGWAYSVAFCIYRFIQFSKPNRLYFQKPFLMAIVLKLILNSYKQARVQHEYGPKYIFKKGKTCILDT